MCYAMNTDDYCPRCAHEGVIYGQSLCFAGMVGRPREAMRHPDGPCKPDAKMFSERKAPRTREERGM